METKILQLRLSVRMLSDIQCGQSEPLHVYITNCLERGIDIYTPGAPPPCKLKRPKTIRVSLRINITLWERIALTALLNKRTMTTVCKALIARELYIKE